MRTPRISRLLPLLELLPPLPDRAPCRPGCSSCCLGPFDISPAEAALLRRAVAALSPAAASGIRKRASEQLRLCRNIAPDWGEPWDTDALGDDRFDLLSAALADLPCPALDPGTGSCLVYDHRPSGCRITGIAVATAEGEALENVCPILDRYPEYAGSPPVPFDLAEWEDRLERLDREAETGGAVRTTVAGALAEQ